MQFSIHCRFLILPLIVIAVLITGCETSTNSIENNGNEELTEELTFSPLPYETSKFLFNPDKSGAQAAKPLAESEPLYGCVLSTLNKPESEYAYSYHAYELSFPQNIVDKAQGKNHVRVFMLANNKANAKAGSFRGEENIVRMARCRIPAAEQANTMVDKALRNFSTGTWLDSAMNKTKSATKSKAAGGSFDWICTEYGSTTYYAYNEEHQEWEVLVIGGCVSGYYVFVEESGSPGGGTGGLGDDPTPPCDDPTLPCIQGPGGGGIGIPQDEDTEELLNSLLEQDEFALLNIPCEEIPKWKEIAQYEVPDTVLSRLEDTDALSGSFIQELEDASGAVVNMDNFSVTVPGNEIPNNWSAEEYLDHIRTNINDYVDGSTFEFYPGLPGEEDKWAQDPLGTLFSIQLVENAPWLDDGTVVASGYSSSFWLFSTVYTPEDNWHPVSGNRLFGVTDNGNGSYTFYTKGVDRLSTRVDQWAQSFLGIPFSSADDLWSSFQDLIANDFANATVEEVVTYRPDYEQVEDVLSGDAPIANLGCNNE